jgi:hypothetical protein
MDSQHTSAESNGHNPREETLSRLSRGAWAKQFLIEAVAEETNCVVIMDRLPSGVHHDQRGIWHYEGE